MSLIFTLHTEFDPGCCSRCAPKKPRLCCDLCHPDEIAAMLPDCSDPLQTPPRATNRIKVPPFMPNTNELELKQALLTWRDAEAKKRYYGIDFYGANLLMHSAIVDRIVELAHANQLSNAADLQNQTGWCFSGQCGADVIAIVLRFCPKPMAALPFARDPLQVRTILADRPVRAAPKPPTCRACGQVGHRSASLAHHRTSIIPNSRPR